MARIEWRQHTSLLLRLLLTWLFSLYVDDLSQQLSKSKVGCVIDSQCMKHFIYVNAICVFAPSPHGL